MGDRLAALASLRIKWEGSILFSITGNVCPFESSKLDTWMETSSPEYLRGLPGDQPFDMGNGSCKSNAPEERDGIAWSAVVSIWTHALNVGKDKLIDLGHTPGWMPKGLLETTKLDLSDSATNWEASWLDFQLELRKVQESYAKLNPQRTKACASGPLNGGAQMCRRSCDEVARIVRSTFGVVTGQLATWSEGIKVEFNCPWPHYGKGGSSALPLTEEISGQQPMHNVQLQRWEGF
ncbi:hypothetical protein BS47DRAFT_1369244 [Hydnum rufescens UP504]|uniref:Uncharacterized protein n=1 Tax=Hydnum rufescens UP504 TaxID=1448309 RepID=A0A9P6AEF7_9AGAM|nr:hypothetical protein BS47DRAFT_1369244 [Hydnum rufescens UP504]